MNKATLVLKYLEKKYGRDVVNSRQRSQKIFELLIETVLSQRTRDENSQKAAEQLFKVARTPKQLSKIPMKKLQSLVRISGPFRQKAKRIKSISKAIIDEYDGRVPNTREELMKLYGVGYKTADIVLMYGFDIPSIAVDTHVNRIPKRIGLVDKEASVEEAKSCLESLFPKGKWYLINMGLVSFGKETCKPQNPVCINDERNCPFSGFCRAYKSKDFKV
jgi:endonuclease III